MTIVKDSEKQSKMPFLLATESTLLQQRTEMECEPFFVNLHKLPKSQLDHLRDCGLLTKDNNEESLDICLLKERHLEYLQKLWKDRTRPQLNSSFVSLDASRSWMIYWSLHACDLLGQNPEEGDCQAIVHTLSTCFSKALVTFSKNRVDKDVLLQQALAATTASHSSSSQDTTAGADDEATKVSFRAGGFGGGPGQMPHAANTYAAVLALSIVAGYGRTCPIASRAALDLLKNVRLELYPWLLSLQNPDNGSFRMQHDGEIDVRATYCVVAVASLLNLLQESIQSSRASDYVASCQTWEGGFGGEPFAEAHGGYTFCAIAALQLLQQTDAIDLGAAAGYLTRRQLALEGGFSGRSNKLVDGCYSFWQGGATAIVSALLLPSGTTTNALPDDPWLEPNKKTNDDDGGDAARSSSFPTSLLFDQAMLERYILLCAQDVHGGLRDKPSKHRDFYHSCYNLSGLSVCQHCDHTAFYGHPTLSRVAQTHPCYNIRIDHVENVRKHFRSKS